MHSAISTYTAVATRMQPTMPTGMSTAGLRVSSASVETQSKPMKEKKTKLAPSKMPLFRFVLVVCGMLCVVSVCCWW